MTPSNFTSRNPSLNDGDHPVKKHEVVQCCVTCRRGTLVTLRSQLLIYQWQCAKSAALFIALSLSLISISTFHSDQGQKPNLWLRLPMPAASFPPWDALGLVWLLVLDSFNHCLSPAFLSHLVAFCVCGNILLLGGRGLADSKLRPSAWTPQADTSSALILC